MFVYVGPDNQQTLTQELFDELKEQKEKESKGQEWVFKWVEYGSSGRTKRGQRGWYLVCIPRWFEPEYDKHKWKIDFHDSGYIQSVKVSSTKEGKWNAFLHHMIMDASGAREKGFQEGRAMVNHLDGNPLNNREDNLEMSTQLENLRHQKCHREGKRSFGVFLNPNRQSYRAQLWLAKSKSISFGSHYYLRVVEVASDLATLLFYPNTRDRFINHPDKREQIEKRIQTFGPWTSEDMEDKEKRKQLREMIKESAREITGLGMTKKKITEFRNSLFS